MQEPPIPNIWWSVPTMQGFIIGERHRGLWAIDGHPELDKPIFVPSCGKCLLVRSTGYGGRAEPCRTCNRPGIVSSGFYLNANEFDGDFSFKKYRKAFKKELLSNQTFFRERFLDALNLNLDKSHTDTHLRVHINIHAHETRVFSVDFQRWKDYTRRDPYEERVKECAKLWHDCPDYKGTGIIVFQFNVHYPRGRVCFDVVMGLPLRKEETNERRKADRRWIGKIEEILSPPLPPGMWYRPPPIDYRESSSSGSM